MIFFYMRTNVSVFIPTVSCFSYTIAGVVLSLLTFVQDGVGWLVSCQRLLAEVLVRLRQALHFCEASVERHGRVARVLGHVQVGCSPKLLLYDQRLLQQLKDTTKEKYLHIGFLVSTKGLFSCLHE